MDLTAVTTFPGHRSAPQSPPTWVDSRRMVWDAVKELRQQNAKAGADERRIGQLLAERMESDDDLREAGAHLLAHDALTFERVLRQRSTSALFFRLCGRSRFQLRSKIAWRVA